MAIDLLRVQAEGLRLLGQIAVSQNVIGGAVQLIAVFIDEIDQVVQLVGIGELEGLPDLALVALAVAYQQVGPTWLVRPSILLPRAAPAAVEAPWPREPVVRSTPGVSLRSVWLGNLVWGWFRV